MATEIAQEGSAGFDGRTDDIWRSYVNSTPAHIVIKNRLSHMVRVKSTDSVSTALSLLAENNISSAPVISPQGVFGIVDVLDIMAFAKEVMGNEKFFPVEMLESKFLQEFERPVIDIIGESGRNHWSEIHSTASLSGLIKEFENPDVHRVAVLDKNNVNDYDAVITQSDLLQFMHDSGALLGPRLKATVKQLWPESVPAITIPSNALVFEAFQKIHRSRVSGLAVVDHHNKLVGNISASDIKHAGLKPETNRIVALVNSLHLPLDKFLNISGPEAEIFKPITVSYDDTVEKLLLLLATKHHTSRFAATHIHRVFVVDENQVIQRTITAGDVISQFRY